MKTTTKCKIAALSLVASMQLATAQDLTPEQAYAFENLRKYSVEAGQYSNVAKEADIEEYRQKYKVTGYRKDRFIKSKSDWKEPYKLLGEDGVFTDLIGRDKEVFVNGLGNDETTLNTDIANYMTDVWCRIGMIADAAVSGQLPMEKVYTEPLLRSILYYGNMEIKRVNESERFHESCFAVPTAAMNTYYAFLDRMDEIEAGGEATQLEKDACEMLKVVALQAWTQPLRGDLTDNDVSSIERFQKHVWWVGGNALAYRSLLPVACMIKSIPMIDVLSAVAQRAISSTSQNTYDDAFWTEGFTADGAGWGHGMQCLVWGYPIDGTNTALSMMSTFKGTSWEKKLSKENTYAILNYLRGSNWYAYKGYSLPCLSRGSFAYVDKPSLIKSSLLIKNIKGAWMDSFTEEEQSEIKMFDKTMSKYDSSFKMKGFESGVYNGIRWFFNNDDLIVKNDDYHVIVNMASVRCDGIESAIDFADEYNFTQCDGLTLFQRDGNEYLNIYGAFDVLRAPGITARLGMDKLTPVTNWRGYCSRYNYAGAATDGDEYGVSGHIFDKMNGSAKGDVNDTAGLAVKNEVLYGVKAYKSNFFFGDYMLALGAGITNEKPEIEGDIHTTIEQTSLENDVYLLRGKKVSKVKGGVRAFKSSKKGLEWLVQEDKFAYTVLPEYAENSFYTTEKRECDWVKMNITNKRIANKTPKKVDVLQVWTDHGTAPVDQKYGYVVYLGDDTPESKKLPFGVLRNDTQIQAAATKDGAVVEAVFYTSDETLTYGKGHSVAVSEPAVVMISRKKGEMKISISDPQMRADLKSIVVSVDGADYAIDMPQGDQCASVVSKVFNVTKK